MKGTEPMLLLGIDPGTKTGFALYDADANGGAGELLRVDALDFWEAVALLEAVAGDTAAVVVEDARRIGLYARRGERGARRDRIARSVGMIDRDVQLWLDLCERLRLPVATVEPTRKKWDAETFRRITGWEGRTNEHARDAGRLVFGRSVAQVLLMAQHPAGTPATSGAAASAP